MMMTQSQWRKCHNCYFLRNSDTFATNNRSLRMIKWNIYGIIIVPLKNLLGDFFYIFISGETHNNVAISLMGGSRDMICRIDIVRWRRFLIYIFFYRNWKPSPSMIELFKQQSKASSLMYNIIVTSNEANGESV